MTRAAFLLAFLAACAPTSAPPAPVDLGVDLGDPCTCFGQDPGPCCPDGCHMWPAGTPCLAEGHDAMTWEESTCHWSGTLTVTTVEARCDGTSVRCSAPPSYPLGSTMIDCPKGCYTPQPLGAVCAP